LTFEPQTAFEFSEMLLYWMNAQKKRNITKNHIRSAFWVKWLVFKYYACSHCD